MKKVLVGFLVFSVFVAPSFASAMSFAGPEQDVKTQLSSMSDLIQKIQARLNELKAESLNKSITKPVVTVGDTAIDASINTNLVIDPVYPKTVDVAPPTVVTGPVINKSIKILTPNFGEKWLKEAPVIIAWNYSPLPLSGDFRIALQSATDSTFEKEIHSCGSWKTYQSNAPTVSGIYSWYPWKVGVDSSGVNMNIPDGQYKITVSDCVNTGAKDTSKVPFTIETTDKNTIKVLGPSWGNGGQTFKVGDTEQIMWQSVGLENVLLYVCSASEICVQITPNPVSANMPYTSIGKYDWFINLNPFNAGFDVRIKVFDPKTGAVGYSKYFKIY